MAELGALKVRIDADSSGLESGMKRASTSIRRGGAELRQSANQFAKWGAAAAAAAAVAGAAIYKSTSRSIDQLTKTADRLGIATERLSGLRFAAEQTGVSTETLDMALQRMTRRVAEAGQGTGEAVKAIKELGLSAQELAQLSPDEQFRRLAEAMQGVSNQGDRVRLAMKLFDSEGVSLVNTMKGGASAIDAFQEEADRLGITLDRVSAEKVVAANDAMNRVSAAARGAAQTFTVELAPIIDALATQFTDAAKEAGGMNEVIINGLDRVATVVGVVANAYRGWELVIAALRSLQASWNASVISGIKTALQAVEDLVNGSINIINEGIFQLNRLPGVNIDFVGLATFESVDQLGSMLNIAESSARRFGTELSDLANQPLPSENIKSFIEEARAASQEAAEIAASAVGGITGDGGEGEAGEDAPVGKYSPEENEKFLEGLRERFASEMELIEMQEQTRLERLREAKEQELLTDQEFELRKTQIEADAAKQREDIAKAEKEAKMNMASSMFSGLSNLMNTESKKLFEIGKAAAISGAIVDAYKGITKTLAEYPYPFNIGMAAAHAATAFAQIQNIKKQQFGSQGSPTTFVDGQPAVRTTGAGGGMGGGQSQGGGQSVNINLVGQSFGRDQVLGMIGAINEAVGDGAVINTGG